MMAEKQKYWPYLFCPRCRRLSPIRYDLDGDSVCKMCDRLIFEDEGGKVVLLDKIEAKARELPFLGEKENLND